MADVNWAALFDEAYPEPGLPAEYLADGVIEGYLFAPPTEEELKDLDAREVTPTCREIAHRQLPPSYKAFLGRSNGGTFVAGDREFAMLKAQELREYLFLYNLPQRMPGAVPFALDGAGGFYLFDLREPPDSNGEYTVLHAPGDRLGFDDAVVLGRSFGEVLRNGRNPADG
jgi:hypothetical protein